MKSLFMLFVLLAVTGCNIKNNNTITAFKPLLSMNKETQRNSFVGKWQSKQLIENGGYRVATIDRFNNGQYKIQFEIYGEDEVLLRKQKEVGFWGVSGGVYFTIFLGFIDDEENISYSSPEDPYNYDTYEIQEIKPNQLTYKSLSTGNIFTYTKI